MSLYDTLTQMRRMLRDPDGTVWTDMDLLRYWNDAQFELSQKTGMLVRVESHYYPPQYTHTVLWDWEREYVEGDIYQALSLYQQTGEVICYPWEAFFWGDTNSAQADGDVVTQPWEYHMTGSPGDVVKIPLHTRFERMLWAAYDYEPITPLLPREVMEMDHYHKTSQGQPVHYWRPDTNSNQMVLYPAPSSVTWKETVESEVFDDAGGIISSWEDYLDESDTGITTDIIDADDALFVIYQANPYELQSWYDDCSYPEWLWKYISYATLERAFSADSDGFIPSLRDYWKQRKELGIEAIKRLKRMRLKDRDYRMGGYQEAGRSRGPRLPAHYPAC